MTPEFKKALNYILYWEGDYSDHPDDGGGKTRYGITEKVARDQGYSGHMKDFPIGLARNIYYSEYWLKVRGNDLWEVDKILAAMVFDFAVNAGVSRSSRCFQSTINRTIDDDDFDIFVDGIIGSQTIEAYKIASCKTFNKRFMVFRMNYYMSLKKHVFLDGWTRRATGFLFLKELGIDL